MTFSNMEKLREDTILFIRSCLISVKGSCDMRDLMRDYKSLMGGHIPYAKLGYPGLEEFLRSVPSLILRRQPNGQVLVDAKPDSLSADIASMVARQKNSKKKPSKHLRFSTQKYDSVKVPSRWRPKNVQNYRAYHHNSPRVAQLAHNQFVTTPRKSTATQSINNNNLTLPQYNSFTNSSQQSAISSSTSSGMTTSQNRLSTTNKSSRAPSNFNTQSSMQQQNQSPAKTKSDIYGNHNVFENDLVRSEKTNRSMLCSRIRTPPQADVESLQKEALAAVNLNDPIWTDWTSSDSDTEKSSTFFVSGDPGKDLWNFTRFRRIAEPEIKVKPRRSKPHRNFIYDCRIKVDDSVYTSYPNDFLDEQSAINYASEIALGKLIDKYGRSRRQSLLTSNDKDIIERIPALVQKHYNGVWSWQVEADYKDLYREALPPNWLRTIDSSPVISVEAFTNKHVLKYCNPEDHFQKGKMSFSALSYDVSIPTSSAQFDDQGCLLAKIMCPVSAEEVWCRQIGTEETAAYEAMSEKFETFYNEAYNTGSSQPASNIVKGSYYAAWNMQHWYRVRALEVTDDGVQCLFVDRGDDLVIPKEDIYILQREFARECAQVFICRLAGLEDLYEISINSEHILDLEGMDVTLEAVDMDDQYQSKILTVVMYDAATGKSLNQELVSSISIENATPVLDLNTPLDVHISHICNNGKFYVQIRSPGFLKLTSLLTEIESSFPTLIPKLSTQEPITRETSLGRLFYGKLLREGDLHYHRLKIIDSKPNFEFAQVLYVDTGKSCVVQMSDVTLYPLEEINSVVSRYPEQAVLVKMHMDTVPDDFVTRFEDLVPQDTSVLMRVVKKDIDEIHCVNIFVRHPKIGLVSVSDSLAMEEKNRESSPSHMQETLDILISLDSPTGVPSTGRLLGPPLPKTGEFYDVKVPLAVNPWNFFIQPLTYYAQLNELMQKMQHVYADKPKTVLPLENIKAGNIYASKYEDKKWYRTCVLKIIHPGSISVFYVDYGYYANLKLQDLVALEKEFLELPYQAIKAKLSGIKPKQDKWTVEDCKYFQKLVENREYVSVLISVENDELYTCDKILKLKLIDTKSSKQDVHIDDLLIQKRIAVKDGN